MAQLLVTSTSSTELVSLEKSLFTLGPSTAISRSEKGWEIYPGPGQKIRVNGETVRGPRLLANGDRIEWSDGCALFLSHGVTSAQGSTSSQADSLAVLQELAVMIADQGALRAGFDQLLQDIVRISGAEMGQLWVENSASSAWKMMASHSPSGEAVHAQAPREFFSNTILKEALAKREPICLESVIGHPWAQAASVVASGVFSVACVPLLVTDRPVGAAFLYTRSPGRSIRKESLTQLSRLAAVASVMLATYAELHRAETENDRLRELVPAAGSDWLVGETSEMNDLKRKVEKLAPTSLNLLVLGETGTGKEVLAREIHRRSDRAKAPFVAVNCAAIPESLIESTLFGHEKGAFTGAIRSQAGKFLLANGGTLFLDEIGELSRELQAKLLRAVQEKVIEPVGSRRSIKVDLRILAATHRDLELEVRRGNFRQDLYFRLNGASLKLPSLRERKNDIAVFARYFLDKSGAQGITFSVEAEKALLSYAWPGNIRELEQVVHRAAILAEGSQIQVEDLELEKPVHDFAPDASIFVDLKKAQKRFTYEYACRVLDRHKGNRSAASAELGISERSLYRILAFEGEAQT